MKLAPATMDRGTTGPRHARRLATYLVFLLSALSSAASLRAEPKWIRMQSPNFEVLSSAGVKETRNTLTYFEQVREFFLKFNGHGPKEPAPVTIVIFGSEKEYEPYSLSQAVKAKVHAEYQKTTEAGVDGALKSLTFDP